MPLRRQVVLHRGRRQHRRRAQQVVAAAMAEAVRRAAAAARRRRLPGDRPGSASYSPRMAMTGPPSPASPMTAVGMPATFSVTRKPCALQHRGVLGAGADLGVGELRHAPDAVGQRLEVVLLGVHQAPDFLGVLQSSSSPSAAAARNKAKPVMDGPGPAIAPRRRKATRVSLSRRVSLTIRLRTPGPCDRRAASPGPYRRHRVSPRASCLACALRTDCDALPIRPPWMVGRALRLGSDRVPACGVDPADG